MRWDAHSLGQTAGGSEEVVFSQLAARTRAALAPIRPSVEFTERLSDELRRVSTTRERLASAVEDLGQQPKRFTRAWLYRYRWALGVAGSAVFAVGGALAVALAWRLRNA